MRNVELLMPAGNLEKLEYAVRYGADAVYLGVVDFSLRAMRKGEIITLENLKRAIDLAHKLGAKAYLTLNIFAFNEDIKHLEESMDIIKDANPDAVLVSDFGILRLVKKYLPDVDIHISTQTNILNYECVKFWQDMGATRVVLARELSIPEIAEIKNSVPEMEIECFVHGAMCIAYAGRCLMSAYLNGRSAQEGFCSHTCRWDYDVLASLGENAKQISESGNLVLREHKRPDEFFPVYEGENFTAVLSSKDLCMIDHLADLKNAGVDSLKIEGRMKSVYYVALITRAYRKAIDALEGKIPQEEATPFVEELYKVSHRPFATGFYYNKSDADVAVSGASDSPFELSAEFGNELSLQDENSILEKAAADKRFAEHPDLNLPFAEKIDGFKMYNFESLNMITKSTELEIVSPDTVAQKILWGKDFVLVNPENGELYNWVCNGHPCVFYTKLKIQQGSLLRSKDPDYVEGKFRDSGR